MANLNTTQIAHDFLGPSQRVYHQDLTVHSNQPRLKIDKLGAGDFVFVDTVPPGQNPAHSYEQKGLLTGCNQFHNRRQNNEIRNAKHKTSRNSLQR